MLSFHSRIRYIIIDKVAIALLDCFNCNRQIYDGFIFNSECEMGLIKKYFVAFDSINDWIIDNI